MLCGEAALRELLVGVGNTHYIWYQNLFHGITKYYKLSDSKQQL